MNKIPPDILGIEDIRSTIDIVVNPIVSFEKKIRNRGYAHIYIYLYANVASNILKQQRGVFRKDIIKHFMGLISANQIITITNYYTSIGMVSQRIINKKVKIAITPDNTRVFWSEKYLLLAAEAIEDYQMVAKIQEFIKQNEAANGGNKQD